MVIQDRVSAGLKALTEEYTQRFAPASLEERFLVETLAISEWRNRRFMRTEAAIWDLHPDAFSGKAGRALDRLHRMADASQRAFSSALKQLMAMQAKRTPKPQSAPRLFVVPKR